MVDSLKSIMEEIHKYKKIAEEKESTDVNVRRMQQGNIRQAKEKLKDLYMQYRKSVMFNSLFMIAVGDKSEKFSKESADSFNTYSVDADQLFKDIADKIPEILYKNKLASSALFDHVVARFEERAMDIDIIGFKPILFTQKYKKTLKSKEELIKMIRDAFFEYVGGEVVGLDAIERASSLAVNDGFDGVILPIVLYTEDSEFASNISKDLNKVASKILVIQTGKTKDNIKADLTIKTINDKNLKDLFLTIKEKVI